MKKVLLVVDVQNDFCEGGRLGVEGGNDVARLAAWRARADDYEIVVASQDWHDPDSTNGGHIALTEQPDYALTWPAHCTAGTWGAELHPTFAEALEAANGVTVKKGRGRPSYSAFEGEISTGITLSHLLAEFEVTHLDVVGIATDHCVKETVLDALKEEFSVRVFTDTCAGVDEQRSAEALETMAWHGAQVH